MASYSHYISQLRAERRPSTGSRRWLVVMCWLVWALLAWPVSADERSNNRATAAGSSDLLTPFVAQHSLSASEAAAQVRRVHGGRVLSVSPSRRGDSLGYRVRVLVDGGRVKTVYVEGDSSTSPAAVDPRPRVRNIGDR